MNLAISKEALGYLSIALNIGGTIPYCWLVIKGRNKPHVFTWGLWALVMAIAGAARSAEHAGPGAWATWAGAGACATIAVFALFAGERDIKRSDVITFVAALAAIPVWQVTQNAFLAMIMVTIIDLLAYYPTIRKSYVRPHQETVFNYINANIIHVVSLLATVEYSVPTLLYPVCLFLANTVLITVILVRRRALRLNEAMTNDPNPPHDAAGIA